jgi:excisionase family DNA binding protein
VLELRRDHGLASHAERLHAAGLLTIDQIAERLGVHRSTIKHWHRAGLLTSHKANDKNQRLFQPPTPGDPRLVKRMGSRLANPVRTQPTPAGAV